MQAPGQAAAGTGGWPGSCQGGSSLGLIAAGPVIGEGQPQAAGARFPCGAAEQQGAGGAGYGDGADTDSACGGQPGAEGLKSAGPAKGIFQPVGVRAGFREQLGPMGSHQGNPQAAAAQIHPQGEWCFHPPGWGWGFELRRLPGLRWPA